jgi:hypothetical protein
MLVLAMEFSRGTTAYRPPSLPGNEKGTARACTIRKQEVAGSSAPKSSRSGLTPTTTNGQMQERIISDQLGVLSCVPKQSASIDS